MDVKNALWSLMFAPFFLGGCSTVRSSVDNIQVSPALKIIENVDRPINIKVIHKAQNLHYGPVRYFIPSEEIRGLESSAISEFDFVGAVDFVDAIPKNPQSGYTLVLEVLDSSDAKPCHQFSCFFRLSSFEVLNAVTLVVIDPNGKEKFRSKGEFVSKFKRLHPLDLTYLLKPSRADLFKRGVPKLIHQQMSKFQNSEVFQVLVERPISDPEF